MGSIKYSFYDKCRKFYEKIGQEWSFLIKIGWTMYYRKFVLAASDHTNCHSGFHVFKPVLKIVYLRRTSIANLHNALYEHWIKINKLGWEKLAPELVLEKNWINFIPYAKAHFPGLIIKFCVKSSWKTCFWNCSD